MTRRQRRLIGRAHRRRQQGVPITSPAVLAAYATSHPSWAELRATYTATLTEIRRAWDKIRTALQPAMARFAAELQITTYHRPAGPLIHQGRKHP